MNIRQLSSCLKRLVSVLVMVSFFFTCLPVDCMQPERTSVVAASTKAHHAAELAESSYLSPPMIALDSVPEQSSVISGQKVRIEKRTSRVAGIVAESLWAVVSGLLAAHFGAAPALMLIIIVMPRLSWNAAVLIHGLLHSGLGAVLGKKASMLNINNLTDGYGLKTVCKALLPFTPVLGRGKDAHKSGVGVADTSKTKVRLQAIAGIAANIITVAAVAALWVIVFSSVTPVLGALICVPVMLMNLFVAFSSRDDWAVFVRGRSVGRTLKAGIIGIQEKETSPTRRRKRSRVFERKRRGKFIEFMLQTMSSDNLLSLGLASVSHASRFSVNRLDGIKRPDLKPSVEVSGRYMRTREFLPSLFYSCAKAFNNAILVPLFNAVPFSDNREGLLTSVACVTPSGSTTEGASSIELVAGKANELSSLWKRWHVRDGRVGVEKIFWTNYIMMDGVYRGSEFMGRNRTMAQMNEYLRRVLDFPQAQNDEAATIAMMMDLLITRGNWERSMRLAFQQLSSREFKDAFIGREKEFVSRKKKTGGFFAFLGRLFNISCPVLVSPNRFGCPDHVLTRVWGQKFDAVFDAAMHSWPGQKFKNGKGLEGMLPEFRTVLERRLCEAVRDDKNIRAWVVAKLPAGHTRGDIDSAVNEFVHKAVDNFIYNDTFEAVKEFSSGMDGALALTTGSTSDLAVVLSAKKQPLAVGFNRSGAGSSGSGARAWSSDIEALNVKDERGRPVYDRLLKIDDRGEIVKLGADIRQMDIYSIDEGRFLAQEEIEKRYIHMSEKENDLISDPLDISIEDPLFEMTQRIPENMREIYNAWEPRDKGTDNFDVASDRISATMENLFGQIRKKAIRHERQKRILGPNATIQSQKYDIALIAESEDDYNYIVAANFVKRMNSMLPQLNVAIISATDFLEHPERYADYIDTDTIAMPVSHSNRRNATYHATRHLFWLRNMASGDSNDEGGVFAVTTRWDTELTRLIGMHPEDPENGFVPNVVSTFSGRNIAEPEMNASTLSLTMTEMMFYIARRLDVEAKSGISDIGNNPFGLAFSQKDSIDDLRAQGYDAIGRAGEIFSQVPDENGIAKLGFFKLIGRYLKSSNPAKRLKHIGKRLAGYVNENMWALLVTLGILVFALNVGFAMPFTLIYDGIVGPFLVSVFGSSIPVLGGISLAAGSFNIIYSIFFVLNVIFWEFLFNIIVLLIRLFRGYPVNMSTPDTRSIHVKSESFMLPLMLSFTRNAARHSSTARRFKYQEFVDKPGIVASNDIVLDLRNTHGYSGPDGRSGLRKFFGRRSNKYSLGSGPEKRAGWQGEISSDIEALVESFNFTAVYLSMIQKRSPLKPVAELLSRVPILNLIAWRTVLGCKSKNHYTREKPSIGKIMLDKSFGFKLTKGFIRMAMTAGFFVGKLNVIWAAVIILGVYILFRIMEDRVKFFMHYFVKSSSRSVRERVKDNGVTKKHYENFEGTDKDIYVREMLVKNCIREREPDVAAAAVSSASELAADDPLEVLVRRVRFLCENNPESNCSEIASCLDAVSSILIKRNATMDLLEELISDAPQRALDILAGSLYEDAATRKDGSKARRALAGVLKVLLDDKKVTDSKLRRNIELELALDGIDVLASRMREEMKEQAVKAGEVVVNLMNPEENAEVIMESFDRLIEHAEGGVDVSGVLKRILKKSDSVPGLRNRILERAAAALRHGSERVRRVGLELILGDHSQERAIEMLDLDLLGTDVPADVKSSVIAFYASVLKGVSFTSVIREKITNRLLSLIQEGKIDPDCRAACMHALAYAPGWGIKGKRNARETSEPVNVLDSSADNGAEDVIRKTVNRKVKKTVKDGKEVSDKVRAAAVRTAQMSEPEIHPATYGTPDRSLLFSALGDPSGRVRKAAVNILGRDLTSDVTTLDLSDRNCDLLEFMIERTLFVERTENVLDLMAYFARYDPNRTVRLAAVRALSRGDRQALEELKALSEPFVGRQDSEPSWRNAPHERKNDAVTNIYVLRKLADRLSESGAADFEFQAQKIAHRVKEIIIESGSRRDVVVQAVRIYESLWKQAVNKNLTGKLTEKLERRMFKLLEKSFVDREVKIAVVRGLGRMLSRLDTSEMTQKHIFDSIASDMVEDFCSTDTRMCVREEMLKVFSGKRLQRCCPEFRRSADFFSLARQEFFWNHNDKDSLDEEARYASFMSSMLSDGWFFKYKGGELGKLIRKRANQHWHYLGDADYLMIAS